MTKPAVAAGAAYPSVVKGYSVVHEFQGAPVDGFEPFDGVTIDSGGRIFGTTLFGGTSNEGTVFGLAPAGDGAYTEMFVHSLACATDGCNPNDVPYVDASDNVFATAYAGGQQSAGTAVELSPPRPDYRETNVYSFPTGSVPQGSFTAVGSTLYTVSSDGGAYNHGYIAALSDPGLHETDVYDFRGGSRGHFPAGYLFADSTGTLFGACSGGSADLGMVFKFVPSAGGGTFSAIWTFKDASQGDGSSGVIGDAAGNLYGTTYQGGADNYGVVFKLSPAGGGYKETMLHQFVGSDGAEPTAPVTLFRGLLYGLTASGTLFRLSPSGSNFATLHTFKSNGVEPRGGLFATGSALFGVTAFSEAHDNQTYGGGVVFRYVP